MPLSQVVANTPALASAYNAIVDMLQGASGSTDAFFFRSSTGNDFIVRLSDAAGARKVVIQDSAGVEVASINSDGVISGVLAPSTITFPTSATPTPTTDGQAMWDSDDNVLAVGDGAATKLFVPDAQTTAGDIQYASAAKTKARLALGTALQVLRVNSGATAPEWATVGATHKYAVATQTVSASTGLVDAIATGSPATMSFSIAANEVWRVEYDLALTFTGTGGFKAQITGPAAPTAVSIRAYKPLANNTAAGAAPLNFEAAVTSFASNIAAANAASGTDNLYDTARNGGNMRIIAYIANGANAGTVTLQFAQNSANGTTVMGIGSMMRAEKIS